MYKITNLNSKNCRSLPFPFFPFFPFFVRPQFAFLYIFTFSMLKTERYYKTISPLEAKDLKVKTIPLRPWFTSAKIRNNSDPQNFAEEFNELPNTNLCRRWFGRKVLYYIIENIAIRIEYYGYSHAVLFYVKCIMSDSDAIVTQLIYRSKIRNIIIGQS